MSAVVEPYNTNATNATRLNVLYIDMQHKSNSYLMCVYIYIYMPSQFLLLALPSKNIRNKQNSGIFWPM